MRKLLLTILLLLPVLLTACINSPKKAARQFAERMPDRIGEFSREDEIELTEESVSDQGHITLVYEADDMGSVYIVMDVYGTEAAAEVARSRRERDLRLMGATFERDEVRRYDAFPRAMVTEMPNGRLAMFEDDDMLVEVQFIKDNEDADISDEDWEAVLNTVRDVGDAVR